MIDEKTSHAGPLATCLLSQSPLLCVPSSHVPINFCGAETKSFSTLTQMVGGWVAQISARVQQYGNRGRVNPAITCFTSMPIRFHTQAQHQARIWSVLEVKFC